MKRAASHEFAYCSPRGSVISVVGVLSVVPPMPSLPFVGKKSKVGFLTIPIIGNNLRVVRPPPMREPVTAGFAGEPMLSRSEQAGNNLPGRGAAISFEGGT